MFVTSSITEMAKFFLATIAINANSNDLVASLLVNLLCIAVENSVAET